MMNFAGIRPGGRYLVIDEASGLLVTAVLERLGGMHIARTSCHYANLLSGEGRILTICDVESPPAYPIMTHMNFDEDIVNETLLSLNWATADEEYTPSEYHATTLRSTYLMVH